MVRWGSGVLLVCLALMGCGVQSEQKKLTSVRIMCDSHDLI